MTEGLLQELSAELAVSISDLDWIIRTAPKRYKVYTIPKRSGGERTIAQPSRELKVLQRYLLETLLSKFPVHWAANGYVHDRSIASNAAVHRTSAFILKLDFKDFFPSILVRDWERVVRKSQQKLSRADIGITSKVMFWGDGSIQPRCLSIGAPTSPALSNIVMYDLDVLLSSAAEKTSVRYSRYADDITVSSDNIDAVLKFERIARGIVGRSKSPELLFNDSKRGLYGKGQRRMVTGLIITPDENVSIGRDRKRLISAMLHRVSIGERDPEHMGKLKGYLGFCIAVEPAFIARLREKYGNGIVDLVLRAEAPKRNS